MIYTREYVNVHIIIMHRLFAGQNTESRYITILYNIIYIYELGEHKTRRVHTNFPNFFSNNIFRFVIPIYSFYTQLIVAI